MRATAGALAALSVLTLAGCARTDEGGAAVDRQRAPEPKVLSVHRGLTDGLRADGPRTRPVAAILGPGRVALATWGSSTCPNVPVRMKTRGPDTLRMLVDIAGPKHAVCTADLGPTTVRLALDPAMTSDGTVALVLDFRHERGDVRVLARPLGEQ